MSTRTYLGRAGAVAQLETITVGGTPNGETYTITINGKDVSFVDTDNAIATIVAGLVAACQASTYSEFTEITWADASPNVTATGPSGGRPFTLTVSKTAGTGTLATATTTAATGPNHFDNVDNWSGGAVPVDGDDVVFSRAYPVGCFYAIDQTTIELASLTVEGGYMDSGGSIGLPTTTDAGYSEYLETYLKLYAATVNIGRGGGTGSTRIRLDLGGGDSNITVYGSGSGLDDGIPAVVLKSTAGVSSSSGAPASTTVEILGGEVGLAIYEGDAMTVDTLRHSGGEVEVGSGVTLADATVSSNASINCSVTGTLTVHDGEVTVEGDGVAGTLDVFGGTVYYESATTIPTGKVGPGTLDLSRDTSPRQITNLTIRGGMEIVDPHRTLTLGAAPTIDASVDGLSATAAA